VQDDGEQDEGVEEEEPAKRASPAKAPPQPATAAELRLRPSSAPKKRRRKGVVTFCVTDCECFSGRRYRPKALTGSCCEAA
jgi:hypothetical protein